MPFPLSVPRRGVRSRALLAAYALGVALLVAGCTGVNEPRYGMPAPADTQAKQTLYLWQGVFVTALVVMAIVWGLIFWSIIRYRKRGNETSLPRQTQYHIPLEITYTVIPVVIVAIIFFFVVHAENIVDSTSATPAVSVKVEGFQWGWRFTYLTPAGTPMAPPIVGNQYSQPVLTLPAGETVRLQLVSDDVIHSFFVPDFLFKRDLVPGINNVVELYIDKTGTFQGHCAEFCGLHHADMNFLVKAVPKGAFSIPGAATGGAT
ncbi:MAG: aa3-type cytochrome oxidase subunit II [Acidimicrobiales bacterium]